MYNVLSLNKNAMKAHQTKMDGVAHDLANVNTYGYKKKEVNFEELRLREVEGEVLKSDRAGDLALNMGVKSGLTKTSFNQGTILATDKKFDMAIMGEGFFGVRDRNNNLLLTRNGGFQQNADASISDDLGNRLEMELYQPFENWTGQVTISKNGQVRDLENGQNRLLGRVLLYKPDNPHNLIPIAEGKYMLRAGGNLENSLTGGGFGDINQYFLEGSNAEIADGMVDMIRTQRAYSMNAKALQTTDDMMTMINGIKR